MDDPTKQVVDPEFHLGGGRQWLQIAPTTLPSQQPLGQGQVWAPLGVCQVQCHGLPAVSCVKTGEETPKPARGCLEGTSGCTIWQCAPTPHATCFGANRGDPSCDPEGSQPLKKVIGPF